MKDTTRSVIIAGFAILAVAVAASTLDSTLVSEESGGSDPGGGGGLSPPQTGSTPGEAIQVPFLTEVLLVVLLVSGVAAVVYALKHWRKTPGLVLAGIVLCGLLVVVIQLLPEGQSTGLPLSDPGSGGFFGGSEAGGESDPTSPSPPSVLLVFVLGLALVGAVAALLRTTGATDESDKSTADTTDVAAVGRAAGRAADRIEADTEMDNEVYRAWQEMTQLLDVDEPETSTPGEFAAAAVEAGLGRDDVDRLTRLFENVRYGNRDPSEEYEQEAVAVFRRIEDRYGEADT